MFAADSEHPRYEAHDVRVYEGLDIEGTTYEIGYEAVRGILGDIHDQTLLDFGSGTGRSSQFLAALGATHIVGVDHNPRMVEAASARNIEHAEFIHIENSIPLEDGFADAAISMSVFTEIREFQVMAYVCNEVHRVLAPGGRFVIETTNPAAFASTFRNFAYSPPQEWESGSLATCRISSGVGSFELLDTYWSEQDYRKALTQAGFEICSVEYPMTASPKEWSTDEATMAPFVILEAIKASSCTAE